MKTFNELDPIGSLIAKIRETLSLWDHRPGDAGIFPGINFQLGEWRRILKALEEKRPDAL